MFEDSLWLSEQGQGVAQVDAQIDGLAMEVGGLWEMLDGLERLLTEGRGLSVSRLVKRAHASGRRGPGTVRPGRGPPPTAEGDAARGRADRCAPPALLPQWPELGCLPRAWPADRRLARHSRPQSRSEFARSLPERMDCLL